MNNLRYNLRAVLIGSTVICVVVVLFRLIVWPWFLPFSSGYWREISDRYALWQTQEMLSLFLLRNQEQAPTTWEELEREFNYTNQSYDTRDLSSLQNRIDIDFSALSENVHQDVNKNKVIIRLKDRVEKGFTQLTPDEQEVNSRIGETLRALDSNETPNQNGEKGAGVFD